MWIIVKREIDWQSLNLQFTSKPVRISLNEKGKKKKKDWVCAAVFPGSVWALQAETSVKKICSVSRFIHVSISIVFLLNSIRTIAFSVLLHCHMCAVYEERP